MLWNLYRDSEKLWEISEKYLLKNFVQNYEKLWEQFWEKYSLEFVVNGSNSDNKQLDVTLEKISLICHEKVMNCYFLNNGINNDNNIL